MANSNLGTFQFDNVNQIWQLIQRFYVGDAIFDDINKIISFTADRTNVQLKLNDGYDQIKYKLLTTPNQKVIFGKPYYLPTWVGSPVIDQNSKDSDENTKKYDLVQGLYEYGSFGKYTPSIGDAPYQTGKYGNTVWNYPTMVYPNRPFQDSEPDLRLYFSPETDLANAPPQNMEQY